MKIPKIKLQIQRRVNPVYDKDKWEKAVKFHGHECPGLAVGFKACQALEEHIPTNAAVDEELVCITENDTCAVDAVQSLLGCTFGKGNLIYKPMGKMAFNFYFRKSGESVRLYFKFDGRDMTREERLNYLLNAPTDELFSLTKPVFELPEPARLFQSVVCEKCGERAREDKIRLVEGKKVCLGCFSEYDR
ncbi:MAG: FmdE family protein [Oscillospiraceae bacterium]